MVVSASMTLKDIGFAQALSLTLERIPRLRPCSVAVWDASGLVLAEDVTALVDSPSLTASTKDGFALRSCDTTDASDDNPVRLDLCGTVVAGQADRLTVGARCAIKVMTGAPLPVGADAVLPSERASEEAGGVVLRSAALLGRNILRRGADVSAGELLASAGVKLQPPMTGLLAAGGIDMVRVHPKPTVAVVATGDEVVAPGGSILPGQLYASNLVTLRSWLRSFGMESRHAVVPDEPARLREVLEVLLDEVDVVLTSGGAWKSQRDFTAEVLREMGAEVVFQRVRLAPGKAASLALLGGKVVFCLPGGPPSNEMAFLQLALPGLLRMAGQGGEPFRTIHAKVTESVIGGHGDPAWTSFFQSRLVETDGGIAAEPMRWRSRLLSQARAEALIKVPEGRVRINAGEVTEVQVLTAP